MEEEVKVLRPSIIIIIIIIVFVLEVDAQADFESRRRFNRSTKR